MPKGLIVMEGSTGSTVASWAPEHPALTLVANRPLALHAADTLQRAGADELIAVVDRRAARAVRTALGETAEGWRWIEHTHPCGAGDGVLAAGELLCDEPFVVHEAEGMVIRDGGRLAEAVADGREDGATLFFCAERLSGVHVLGPAVLTALEEVSPVPGAGRSLASAVDRLAERGGQVRAGILEDWWTYGAGPEDLLSVNRRALDSISHLDDHTVPGARVEGRVRIHPTAEIHNAVIRGPVTIGAHAQVTDAYIGPYSSIGDGAIIENAEVAGSVVLPRARIRHLGVRVEDSIIGAGATIGRDFSLPKALRLVIGRDAQIALA